MAVHSVYYTECSAEVLEITSSCGLEDLLIMGECYWSSKGRIIPIQFGRKIMTLERGSWSLFDDYDSLCTSDGIW